MAVKLLIVGLRGASWEVLEPAMVQGAMPVLADLAQSGRRGNVRGHLPTYLAPNWATFWTGVHPGRHLVLATVALDRRGVRHRSPMSDDLPFPTSLDLLRASGLATATVNAPLIREREPLFDIQATHFPRDGIARRDARAAFVEHHQANLELTRRHGAEICRVSDPSVALIDFPSLDRLLHALWGGVDDPDEAAGGETLTQVLRRMDEELGRLVNDIQPKAVMLFSTHGMMRCRAIVRLAPALVAAGDLQVTTPRRSAYRRLKRSRPVNVVRRLVGGSLRPPALRSTPRPTQPWRLNRSGVSSIYLDDKAIYLRGEAAAIDDLRHRLEALVDPTNGGAPIAAAWYGEDLYGSLESDAKVLVLEQAAGYTFRTGRPDQNGFARITPWADYLVGTHTATGLWLFSTPGATGSAHDVVLEDFAPALLQYFDRPVPDWMLGRAEAVIGDARA